MTCAWFLILLLLVSDHCLDCANKGAMSISSSDIDRIISVHANLTASLQHAPATIVVLAELCSYSLEPGLRQYKPDQGWQRLKSANEALLHVVNLGCDAFETAFFSLQAAEGTLEQIIKGIDATVTDNAYVRESKFILKLDETKMSTCEAQTGGAFEKFQKMADEVKRVKEYFVGRDEVVHVVRALAELSIKLTATTRFFQNVYGATQVCLHSLKKNFRMLQGDLRNTMSNFKSIMEREITDANSDYQRLRTYAARLSRTSVIVLLIIQTFVSVYKDFLRREVKKLIMFFVDTKYNTSELAEIQGNCTAVATRITTHINNIVPIHKNKATSALQLFMK